MSTESIWNQKETWYKRLGDHEYEVTSNKIIPVTDPVLYLKLPRFEMTTKPTDNEQPVVVANYSICKETSRGCLYLGPKFKWDGPSGPAIDTESTMLPSAGHDAFYRVARMKRLGLKYRAPVDKLYRINLRENGTWPPRVWWHWFGVHKAARFAWVAEAGTTDKLYTVTLFG
jgi:hypothetical protein